MRDIVFNLGNRRHECLMNFYDKSSRKKTNVLTLIVQL